jgi:hypothetical protein
MRRLPKIEIREGVKTKRAMGPFQQDVVSPRTVDLIQDSNYRGCSKLFGLI